MEPSLAILAPAVPASPIPVALLSPQVQVCALTMAMTCGAVVANLTATYDPAANRFVVNWSVGAAIDRTLTYRATMRLFNAAVASVDLRIAEGDVTPISFALLVTQFSLLPPTGGSVLVPASGAIVGSADGAFSLVVPAGALAAATNIAIAPAAVFPATDGEVAAANGVAAFDLQPDGLAFNTPATMTVAYNTGGIPPGFDEDELGLHTALDGEWDEDGFTSADLVNHTVTGQLAHFSVHRVLVRPSALINLKGIPPGTGAAVVPGNTGFVVTAGMPMTLGATAVSKRGTPLASRRIGWSLPSGAQAIATTTARGGLTPLAPGATTLSAVSGRANRTIALQVVAAPSITSFTAAASAIQKGGSTTLTPVFANGSGVITPGGIPAVSGTPVLVSPLQTTAYTLAVTNAAGTTAYATTTVAVGSVSASAGAEHSVVVRADGTLWAWGGNSFGQVGNGTRTNVLRPLQIGSGYAFAVAGGYFTLAFKSDGTLWGWGKNSAGELGIGTNADVLTPMQIGSGFVSVSGGLYHVVAVKSDGTLWTWGWNYNGQLGNGTTKDSNVPVNIGSGFAFPAAGGEHSIAIKSDGTLWSWGNNAYGQVGDGTLTDRLMPFFVGSGFAFATTGFGDSLAIKNDGTLWAWGGNNGGLGDGTTITRLVPEQVTSGFTYVSSRGHTVALKADGTLWAFGWNLYGQLGDGTTTDRLVPVQVGTNYVAASAGQYHTVAVKTDGTIWTWGHNPNGQLGNGTVADSSVPVRAGSAIITTVAGTGTAAFSGDNGPAASAALNYPIGVALDAKGNLFIADSGNQRIRRVDATTRMIRTVAGNGTTGFSGDGGPATSASLAIDRGTAIAVDAFGNLYIADAGNNRVRRVDAVTGIITTVAGSGVAGYNGDNLPARTAMLSSPGAVAFDTAGNFFIAEWNGQRVRRVDSATGVITTVAGNGIYGLAGDNGPATAASMTNPAGIVLDRSGNLYIADYRNWAIRRVDAVTQIITSFIRSGQPWGLALDGAGNLYAAEITRSLVQKIDLRTGAMTDVAGTGVSGFSGDNGPPTNAQLSGPAGIAFDGAGQLFIAEYYNSRIRAVTGL